jgi:hypothetical protein
MPISRLKSSLLRQLLHHLIAQLTAPFNGNWFRDAACHAFAKLVYCGIIEHPLKKNSRLQEVAVTLTLQSTLSKDNLQLRIVDF